ncbi:putative nucleic acid-binding Zn ribbon protein [Clavibacter sp. B3I6]|uniref:hypothetical protein n=1 Tax=Clavibacter sp. B3I6 TaxID=3042268 RepID=UPI00277DC089|nr:hypothetical protein [Clavibacter sp. B3I6]MDQ0744893.1 putative nucleic acid-binding Zn ribbon protein [Clavibacter sp. B3I6]
MTPPRATSASADATTAEEAGGLAVRVALVASLAVLWLGLSALFGAGLWAAVQDLDRDVAVLLPQLLAGLVVLGFAPMVGLLGDPRPSAGLLADARPVRPRRIRVWVGITALAATVHAVGSALTDVPVLVIIGFLLDALATMAISGLVGRRAQLARAARGGDHAEAITIDLDWTEADLRRKRRLMALAFVVALVASIVVALLFPRDGDDALLQTAMRTWSVSFLAAGIVGFAVTTPALLVSGSIISDLPTADQRAAGRRARGLGERLDPELEWRAARLAAVSRILQPFLIVQTVSVLAAVLLPVLVGGDAEGWMLVMFGLFAVLILVMMPAIVRQVRNTRRYATQTRDLARSYGPVEA